MAGVTVFGQMYVIAANEILYKSVRVAAPTNM